MATRKGWQVSSQAHTVQCHHPLQRRRLHQHGQQQQAWSKQQVQQRVEQQVEVVSQEAEVEAVPLPLLASWHAWPPHPPPPLWSLAVALLPVLLLGE